MKTSIVYTPPPISSLIIIIIVQKIDLAIQTEKKLVRLACIPQIYYLATLQSEIIINKLNREKNTATSLYLLDTGKRGYGPGNLLRDVDGLQLGVALLQKLRAGPAVLDHAPDQLELVRSGSGLQNYRVLGHARSMER